MEKQTPKKKILIIGAGASGMAAAYTAAKNGAGVTVLEHNKEAGRKLCITGNGKCNYTNTHVSPGHYNASGRDFLKKLFDSFGYEECIEFFKGMGVNPVIRKYRFDDSGYVYPEGMDASGLRDALYGSCLKEGAGFIFGCKAENAGIVRLSTGKFKAGFLSDEAYDSLILATGSNAAPETGSDSSIYPLIKALGLPFNTFLPALCPLYTKDKLLESLKGKRAETLVRLIIGGVPAGEEYGEVQFNAHSISGIPVMQISGMAAKALKEGKICQLAIDGHSFLIYRTAGFNKAQTASGGIDLKYINPDTMESLSCKGVYICGELLDAYGECGGYNLHLAWASGHAAGKGAAAS